MPDPATAVTAWLMTPGIGVQLPTLEDLTHRPAWQTQAACRGLLVDTFFPSPGVSAAQMAKVRAVCAGCPVRADCLDYARADASMVGVWGGTSRRERRRLRVVA